MEPTLGLAPERVVITDYKSSDVRDPAKARQRARDSLQLSIYAMAYEAMTGRLPDAVALHFLESGLVGTAPVDRKRIEKAQAIRPDRSRRASGPARSAPSRTTSPAGYCAFREICPSSAVALMAGGLDAARRSRRSPTSSPGGLAGAVVEADNLDLLAALPDGVVDLVYADPPFATGSARRLASIKLGAGERTRPGFRGESTPYQVTSDLAYDDGLPLDEHLAALGARLREVHRVLAPHGSLYLHVDWRTVHHVRLLLDEVFGPERFLNEIVWAYDYGGRSRGPLAPQARHDPVVREGGPPAVRPRRDRPRAVPGAGARRAREGGPRQAADGRVVAHDRPAGLRGSGRATRRRSRSACWSGSWQRRAGRATSCSTRTRAAGPRARRLHGSGAAGCWWTATRPPSRSRGAGSRRARAVIEAVTLDFGNTLVPVPAGALRAVVAITAEAMAAHLGPFEAADVLAAWHEERERQFREEVPQFREVDLAQRVVRILARLRGMAPPPADRRWDDDAAARLADPAEVAWAVDDLLAGVRRGAAARARRRRADRAAGGGRGAWPSSPTGRSPPRSTATARSSGWAGHLAAIVVSQRVGTIKPHPAIFAAARSALGDPDPAAILHVGDDWAADVVGAKRAGWRAAWLASRPEDSPLPGSDRDDSVARGPRDRRARGARGRDRAARAASLRRPRRPGHAPYTRPVETRDRLAAIGLLAAAAVSWVLVGILVTTRDPYQDAMAGYTGALLIGLAVWLTCAPLAWLVVFARHRRIAYNGDWFRAIRRGAWIGLFCAVMVVLRLVDAFQLPIVLFLAAIFVVAEITLSAER